MMMEKGIKLKIVYSSPKFMKKKQVQHIFYMYWTKFQQTFFPQPKSFIIFFSSGCDFSL